MSFVVGALMVMVLVYGLSGCSTVYVITGDDDRIDRHPNIQLDEPLEDLLHPPPLMKKQHSKTKEEPAP